jgi:glycosyltransferase involved in cell wall biosynthesis
VRVLIDYRPALRERSGVGEYTHELARALLAEFPPEGAVRPLELTLFSSSWKDRFGAAPDLTGAARVDRRVPVSVLNFAWHRLGWPPIEGVAGGRFDVAHSSHPLLMPARHAAQVVTIHDLDFLAHPERTRAEIRRDYPHLVGEHARRADAVIVSSSFTAGEVERLLGVARERIAVCPHGAPDWRPRQERPADGYILFFGTLEPRKNVGGLLDAYERIIRRPAGDDSVARLHADRHPGDSGSVRRQPDRHRGVGQLVPELVIAGRATDAARPWLDRIARPPLAGRVRYIGYVDRSQRRAVYAGARMLVQPSFDEGFGITVLEAMSLGVPVVAARRGSLPEVAGDAVLFVEPDQPDDIARAIDRLLQDERVAAECAAKGLTRTQAFSWRATARRVYETYQQAIARRARSRSVRL